MPAERANPVACALPVQASLLDWYQDHARDLPWRRRNASPWGVLVSEMMLQQTPVRRVLPVWQEWIRRWPTPAALAAEAPGEAVRAWGRLGYPRRALRLHAMAQALVKHHDGRVPSGENELLALPGIGRYTAAAVASFAFGTRCAVVDTNVRRVQARAMRGRALPAPALTSAELRLAEELLPPDDGLAARWNVAVMELGALVCTARSPDCELCPIRGGCAWVAAGSPPYAGPPRRGQAWQGTDRQVRGRMLQLLRSRDTPAAEAELLACADDLTQARRCLLSLLADGLLDTAGPQRFRLPG